jgi:pyrroline-5-carboxylate reductase
LKIGFLGGGNMASALIGGMIAQGWAPADILAADIDAGARERLAGSFGIFTAASASEIAAASDCLVFAVKPQQLRTVAAEVATDARRQLIVSIAAGILTRDLGRWLGGHDRIVRVMPNTPALLRAGISAAFATAGVSPDDKSRTDALLSAVGKVIWVDDEGLLDGVTAVSGSGPAYAFYLIEAMQEAAARLGFDAEQARLLSIETVLGAAKLAAASDETAATLRARVTSKGGTTERAVSVLDTREVKAHMVEAILAAADKSRELGAMLGKDAP